MMLCRFYRRSLSLECSVLINCNGCVCVCVGLCVGSLVSQRPFLALRVVAHTKKHCTTWCTWYTFRVKHIVGYAPAICGYKWSRFSRIESLAGRLLNTIAAHCVQSIFGLNVCVRWSGRVYDIAWIVKFSDEIVNETWSTAGIVSRITHGPYMCASEYLYIIIVFEYFIYCHSDLVSLSL